MVLGTTLIVVLGASLAHAFRVLNCSTSFFEIQESVDQHKPLSLTDDSLSTGILKAYASSCEADRETGALIVDVGSNKGSTLLRYFTIWSNLEDVLLRKWYHSQDMFEFDKGKHLLSAPQVYALDPLKSAEIMTKKLIVDFQLTGFLHFDALAMSNTTGTVHMYLPQKRGRVDEGGQVETGSVLSQWRDRGGLKVDGINMTTLDNFLKAKKLHEKEITFLKIDVEKLDFLVIKGASRVFDKQLVHLGQYEYIRGAIDLIEITSWLKQRGYASYVLWGHRKLLRLDGLSTDAIKQVGAKIAQLNILFARIKDRCVAKALVTYVGETTLFPYKCFH